jgi:hypothetical protein
MAEPIVFISRFRVKEGKLEGYRAFVRDAIPKLETEKPRTLVFLMYVTEDGRHLTVVHVFGDAESMDEHIVGGNERSRLASEFLEPEGWEIYGTASDSAVEMLRGAAFSAGVTLNVQPQKLGGFLRPQPG